MSEQKDLEFLKKRLIIKYPRFASQIAGIEIEFKTNLLYDTAGTDGKKIYFSPNFVKNQPEDVVLFVLAHEVMHIKFRHNERVFDKNGKERDRKIWNIATDAIINANLERDGLKDAGGGVKIEGALNFSAEELYKKLYDKEKKKQEQMKNQMASGGEDGSSEMSENTNGGKGKDDNPEEQKDDDKIKVTGESNDDHSMWDNDKKKSKGGSSKDKDSSKEKLDSQDGKGEENSNDKSQKKEKQNDNLGNEDKKSEDDNEKTENKDLEGEQSDSDSKSAGKDGISEARQNTADSNEIIDERAEFKKNREQKIGRMQGTFEKVKSQIAKENQTAFGEVGKESKIVDWKVLLRRELDRPEQIWSQRRSIAENNFAYRLEDYDVDDESVTEVLLDTSVSVPNRLLMQFLRALKSLAKQSKIKVASFDDDVHLPFVEIKNIRDIDNLKLVGGGGTNFDNAVLAFSKDPSVNKVVFTDGFATLNKDYKYLASVVWVVYKNRDFDPPLGKVIQVSEEALDDLKNTNFKTNYEQNCTYKNINNEDADEINFEK